MENLTFEYVINNVEIFSYFSAEVVCLLGIILNFICFLFLKKKFDIKRVSDFVTVGTFVVVFLILSSIYLSNVISFENVGFTLFNDIFLFSNNVILYKSILTLFFIVFLLVTYKITRKLRFKATLVNSTLLAIAPFAYLLIQSQNVLLAYFLFEVCLILVYKYASNSRKRAESVYSSNYIAISSLASVLFLVSYSVSSLIAIDSQLVFANIVATIALMLKIGIFPIYNHTLSGHCKSNITFSILSFLLIPFLGMVTYIKYLTQIDSTNSVYVLVMTLFLIFTIITTSLNAFKTKNLIKYSAYVSIIFFALNMVAALFYEKTILLLNTSSYLIFALLAFYSLLCVLKIELKSEKLNKAMLDGFAYKNRFFGSLFSILLLIITNVIPSILLVSYVLVLKEIYVFDEIGIYVIFAAIIANVMILFNALQMIRQMYSKSEKPTIKLTKQTMLNYIVCVLIILFLIIKMFL